MPAFESPDEAIARVNDDVRRAENRAASLSRVQGAIAELRGVAKSRAGDVRVEVDTSGALKDLEVSDTALDRGGRELAGEVLRLVAMATVDVQRRMLELTIEVMGDEDPIVRTLEAAVDGATGGGSE